MRSRIGLFLFAKLTQPDLTGPCEVFIRFPETDVHLEPASGPLLAPIDAGQEAWAVALACR